MNLYQAGYYRLGTQGANAGWQLVSESSGMSQKAKEGFQGIASTIISLKSANVPVQNLGVFKFDRFVYLFHINYNASGEDARGVSYAHCYCFNQKDYLELSKNPEMLFGVSETAFPNEYDASVGSYPVAEQLPYAPMSVAAIKAKYNISDEQYREMVLGAISATEGLTPALCLKKDLPKEAYREFYNEMLYLIDVALPYQIRTKITAYSYSGSNDAYVYVSDQVNSTNYVDFDTNQYHLEYDRVKNYEFTMIYNSVPEIDKLASTWEKLSDWIQLTMANSPKEGGCEQIEAAYNAVFKRSVPAGIAPQRATELLISFMQYEPTDCKETYDYLAALLHLINESQTVIDDKKLNKSLVSRYVKSEHDAYRSELDVLLAERLLNEEDRKSAYNGLYEIYKERPTQYERVYALITKKSLEFSVMFRLKKLLPEELTDFDKIQSHIEEVESDTAMNPALAEQDLLVTLSCLKKVASDNFQSAGSFADLQATEQGMQKSLKKLSGKTEKIDQNVVSVGNQLYALLWSSFRMNWFDPQMTESYRSCELDYVSTLTEEPHGREAAQTVINLIHLVTGRFDQNKLRILQNVVFSGNAKFTNEKIQELQLLVLNQQFETKQVDLFLHDFAFDTLLTICYNPSYRQFDVAYLGRLLERYSAGRAFENKNINQFVRYSKLIATQGYGDSLLMSLMDLQSQADQYKASGLSQGIIKGLKKYQLVMEGKELKSEQMLSASNGFLTALYRGTIGVVVMGVLGLVAFIVKTNLGLEQSSLYFVITLAMIGLVYIGIVVMKLLMSGQINYIPEDAGLTTPATIVVYLIVMLFLITGLAVSAVLSASLGIAVVVWTLIAYLILSLVFIIISDIYVEVE